MYVLTCPVLESFLASVLQLPATTLNKEIHEGLTEVKLRGEQERVDTDVVRKRALRAYELAYNAVLSTDLENLEIIPPRRAGPTTLDWFLEKLHLYVDDAIVDNMEFALGDRVQQRGPHRMRRVTMQRLHHGGTRLMDETEFLRHALENGMREDFRRMGVALADICQVMAIGMSRQLLYAEELLRA